MGRFFAFLVLLAALARGGAVAEPPRVPLALTLGEFPYGTGYTESEPRLDDARAKRLAGLGMNFVLAPYPADSAPVAALAASAERHNIYMYMLCTLVDRNDLAKTPPQKWAQTFASGQFATEGDTPSSRRPATRSDSPRPCPLSPSVIRHAADRMRQYMPAFAGHANIRGVFGTETWVSTLAFRPGGADIACYSPWANARFRKATDNKKAPPPVFRKPGYVAPEDDLWLRWCQIVRQDCEADYNQAVGRAARKVRPDLLVAGYRGGAEDKTDLLTQYVTPSWALGSELKALERLDVRANWREDTDRSAIPVYAVASRRYSGDSVATPASLRLTVASALGACARGVILDYPKPLWSHAEDADAKLLVDETRRLGDHLAVYGGMYLALRKPASPVWMLSHWGWVNSFDSYCLLSEGGATPEAARNADLTGWHSSVSRLAVPAALRAGLPVEFVTEKQLMGDGLFACKAVLLPGLLHCRAGVVKNLERYIEQGGKVFVDQSTRVRIEGATTLPVDFSTWRRAQFEGVTGEVAEFHAKWRGLVDEAIPILKKHVTDVVKPDVSLDGADGAWRILANGATKYLFVFNSNTDESRKFAVTVRNLPPVAYDVVSGRLETKEAEGLRTFELELPAGGWRVVAFAEGALRHLRLARPRLEGNALRLSLALFDDGRERFRAAVPVRITLHGADGAEFTLHRSTSDGALALNVPIAGSAPVPVKVTVTELFTGMSVSQPVIAR